MTSEVVTRSEDLVHVAARWDELAKADSRDGFFRTYGWYRAWMEHIRPDAQPFVIIVRDSTGTIVGLAPLCIGTYSDLGFRLTQVAFGGREVVSGDFIDFLAEPESRSRVVPAIVDSLWRNQSQWNVATIGEILQDGETCQHVRNAAERFGISIREQEQRICPYIALPATFEDYLATLSSSTRYHIRRRMRDLDKNGVRVEVLSTPGEIASALDTFAVLHAARWRKENQTGTLVRPGFQQFLRSVCTAPPAGASCRLYRLTHQGTPVAALLMFYFGTSALYYQAGWDPDSPVAQYSPGMVAMAHSIRDAIDAGLSHYEFLRGDETYKFRWTSTHRKTTTVLLARGFPGRQYLWAGNAKDRVKHVLHALRRDESTTATREH